MVVVLGGCVKGQVGAEVGEVKSFGVGARKSAGIAGSSLIRLVPPIYVKFTVRSLLFRGKNEGSSFSRNRLHLWCERERNGSFVPVSSSGYPAMYKSPHAQVARDNLENHGLTMTSHLIHLSFESNIQQNQVRIQVSASPNDHFDINMDHVTGL